MTSPSLDHKFCLLTRGGRPGLAATLAALLLVVACGSTNEDGTKPLPKEQFPDRFAAAVCGGLGSCCQAAGFAYDGPACQTAIHALAQDLLDDAGPSASYDAEAAGRCIAWLQGVVAACGVSGESPCDAVFVGNTPPGGSCQTSDECAKPAGGEALCRDGTCAQLSRGREGDVCSGNCSSSGNCAFANGGADTLCYLEDGLMCDDERCVSPPHAGEACQGLSGGCAADSYCSSGLCVPRGGAGASCADFSECQVGLYCDAAGRCAQPLPDGAACTSDSECSAQCNSGVCGPEPVASAELCSGNF